MPQKKVQRHRLVLVYFWWFVSLSLILNGSLFTVNFESSIWFQQSVIGRDDTKAGLTAATALPLCGSSMMFVAISKHGFVFGEPALNLCGIPFSLFT
ncbi:hypothetical protein ES288_D02G148900v1 [Gossypium darwinii]|uniref:Uncharacterized protein n=1 Tax=Gossypium darwinii TaxID=34276 RepID=A0A5D2DFV6_GOSDA|nr:hypothetical protein ES288_D02G148900v1 [Gossypium darwinii]